MKGPASASGTVPVGPLLSMYDPVFVGIDEFGAPVTSTWSTATFWRR